MEAKLGVSDTSSLPSNPPPPFADRIIALRHSVYGSGLGRDKKICFNSGQCLLPFQLLQRLSSIAKEPPRLTFFFVG
jgi:hypothetical protein